MFGININSTDYWTGLLSGLSLSGIVHFFKLVVPHVLNINKPPLVLGRLVCSPSTQANVLRKITYQLHISNRDTLRPVRIEKLFNHGQLIPLPKHLLIGPGENGITEICSFQEHELPNTWQQPLKMSIIDSNGKKWPVVMDEYTIRILNKVKAHS